MSRKNFYQNNNSDETGFKFDARLRHSENLISARNILVQMNADRLSGKLKTPIELIDFRSAVYVLYSLLVLHDKELKCPDFDKLDTEYIEKLLNHKTIEMLTYNEVKTEDPAQAVRNKFKI